MKIQLVLFGVLAGCTTDTMEPTPTPPAPVEVKAEPAAVTASEAPQAGARVFFIEPLTDTTVTSPVAVKMGVEGMTIKPAGTMEPGTGHHHIIIDTTAPAKGQVVPADAQHIHYGDGRTETTLELTPGPHTLTLQLADGAHASYGPEMSATINVTVGEGTGTAQAAAEPAAAPAAETHQHGAAGTPAEKPPEGGK